MHSHLYSLFGLKNDEPKALGSPFSPRGLALKAPRRKQIFQHWPDAPRPGSFVVERPTGFHEVQIIAELPAFCQQGIAQLLGVIDSGRAFTRANVEPDF